MRETVHLGCEECTRRNYHTTKNKRTTTEKLALKKYNEQDNKFYKKFKSRIR